MSTSDCSCARITPCVALKQNVSRHSSVGEIVVGYDSVHNSSGLRVDENNVAVACTPTNRTRDRVVDVLLGIGKAHSHKSLSETLRLSVQ